MALRRSESRSGMSKADVAFLAQSEGVTSNTIHRLLELDVDPDDMQELLSIRGSYARVRADGSIEAQVTVEAIAKAYHHCGGETDLLNDLIEDAKALLLKQSGQRGHSRVTVSYLNAALYTVMNDRGETTDTFEDEDERDRRPVDYYAELR